jgi:hypothetical protein
MYFLFDFISKLAAGQAFTRAESSTPGTSRKKPRFPWL